jgi:hypothetical protein
MHTNVLHLIEVLLIKAKKQNEQVQPRAHSSSFTDCHLSTKKG